MNIRYMITGYDKTSEQLMCEYNIPADVLSIIVADSHPNAPSSVDADMGAQPLTVEMVRYFGFQLGKDLDPDEYNWFLEPYAV
jgi:hypothetical protein